MPMNCAALIHLFALHAGNYDTSLATPGAGVICQVAQAEVAAGVYRNSERHTSVYAVAGGLPWSIGPVRLGAFAGTVNGYTWRQSGNYRPFAGLQATVPSPVGTLRLQLVPRPSRDCIAALGVGLQF